jgi:hypothetical protein
VIRALSSENFLFHRPSDTLQVRNLWESAPEQRERMLDILRRVVDTEGAPPEQAERLGL